MNMRRIIVAAAAAVGIAASAPVIAQTKAGPVEIQFWMGLTGLGGELLQKYGEDFNKTQNEYRVVVSFKGQYPEQRAAAQSAHRRHRQYAPRRVLHRQDVFARQYHRPSWLAGIARFRNAAARTHEPDPATAAARPGGAFLEGALQAGAPGALGD